jgi:hypothetical protein
LDDRGSIPGRGRGYRVQTGSGAHPGSYPIGAGVFYPRGNATGREGYHSSPSSAEVKNAWSYSSALPIRLHGVILS